MGRKGSHAGIVSDEILRWYFWYVEQFPISSSMSLLIPTQKTAVQDSKRVFYTPHRLDECSCRMSD